MLSLILASPYLLVIATTNHIDFPLPVLGLMFAMLVGILITYIVFIWTPLILLRLIDVKWAFTNCEFFGSCPNKWGFLFIALSWLVVAYLLSCLYVQFKKIPSTTTLPDNRIKQKGFPIGMCILAAFFASQLVSILGKIVMPDPPGIYSLILLSGFTTRVYRIIVASILAALLYGIIRKKSYTIVLGISFLTYKFFEKTMGITIQFWHLFPSKEFIEAVTFILPLALTYILIIFYLYKKRRFFAKGD